MPSRTSVFSLNITLAPARTSRSVQKPTAGLAVTPLRRRRCRRTARPPPVRWPARSRAARVQALQVHFGLAQDVLDHRHEADMRSSCRQTTSSWASAARSSTGDRARRQQPLGLQLLAAQADHHHLAAEVGVQADVAQRADGDHRIGRVDGHAAAVAVLQRHHVVHVRVRGSSSALMRCTANGRPRRPRTARSVVMARMLRVPTEPSALR
jgi:hypothetical protein